MSARIILDRTIRCYVAEGSGIATSKVIPARSTHDAPPGLYASVVMVDEVPVSHQTHQQRIGDSESFTIEAQELMSTYDIQFYRDGAIDTANRFAMWARSETGSTWAVTSLTCGRLKGVNVYEGGSGYSASDTCTFPHDEDDPTPNGIASGTLEVNATGGITAITLDRGGYGYSLMPTPLITSTNGTGAQAAPRGYGFTIDRIKVRNLTGIESGEYEERAQIDLDIRHIRIYNDVSSGRVERLIGDFPITNVSTN